MVRFHFYDPDEDDARKAPRKKKRSSRGGFTMDWVEELGWSANPFTRTDYPIAGLEDERKEINLFFVKGKRLGAIHGDAGLGKTTLLSWLHQELDDYADIDNTWVDAEEGTDVEFLQKLWKPFKPLFGSNLPGSHEELVDAVEKKAKGRYVLLVDNADHLEEVGWEAIKALLDIDDMSVIVTLGRDVKLPAKDELGITLDKPSSDAYERILEERIASVGGHGIHPFTEQVIKTMAADTENVTEFLSLAEETAINIALKHATLEDDVPEEELAAVEERKAEAKKGILPTGQTKTGKKREYDELIESLIED